MKIAFFADLFPRLSETFILNQITGLIDRGHEVDIFAGGPSNEEAVHEDVLKYGLQARTSYFANPAPRGKLKRMTGAASSFVRAGNRRSLLRSLNIIGHGREALSLELFYRTLPFLGKGPYDIIQCHFGPNGDLAVLLKTLGVLSGKIVTMFHGYDIRRGQERGGEIYRRLFDGGDLFLAISDYNHRNLVSFGLEEKKIAYHPVGVKVCDFPFKWSSHAPEKEKKVRVLTVARLVKEKGLHYGIQAVHALSWRRPEVDLEYVIVGSGPLEEELKTLTDRLGMAGIVKFLGAKDRAAVAEEMNRSDIFLLPSIAEALPVTLMEAHCAGMPVIASAVGSVNQIVLDGRSGFCVPARDVGALFEKLNFLISKRERWKEMGAAGRRHVEENFNIDTLNDGLVAIYEAVLGRTHGIGRRRHE